MGDIVPADNLAYLVKYDSTQGRFNDARDFRYVIVKSTDDGRLISLQDVARIELGAKDYVTNSYLNGKPAVALAIFQRPGTNALAAAAEIQEVYKTILEAMVLVIIVIIVFLQSWRMAIVPIVAIPVSLIGTLAVLYAAGFSIPAGGGGVATVSFGLPNA